MMLTYLVDIGSCLNELTNYNILSVVAGQVERCITIAVCLIHLRTNTFQ